MCINSFNILNGEMQAIGTGIYLAPSVIDHSCSPNAVATFDGFKLRIRVTQDLPKLDWSFIYISYIDLMNSKNHRKKELKERYYFDCNCPRCGSDEIDCYHYAARCPSCRNPITVRVCIKQILSQFLSKIQIFFVSGSFVERRQISSLLLWIPTRFLI